MDMESLKKLLDKAAKEEGIAAEEQPLHIDEKDEVIKCHWCRDHFKGSVELKHINQHVKKAAFHSRKRKDITKKGADIRNFFVLNYAITPSLMHCFTLYKTVDAI